MKKIKVYVLQNARKEYGRFDIWGWDFTPSFIYATKFFTLSEAKTNVKLINYIINNPKDYSFQAVKKIVKVK